MEKKHGQGTFTYPDGDKVCRGIQGWRKEMVKEHTLGLMERKYEGKWKNGKEHGQGTLTLPTGGGYVGEFKEWEKDWSRNIHFT